MNVDGRTPTSLTKVIRTGEDLLDVQFHSDFVSALLAACFDSVHIVQEVCRRCLRAEGIFQTQDKPTSVGVGANVPEMIAAVVDEQGGRFNGFLMNFAGQFPADRPRNSSLDRLRHPKQHNRPAPRRATAPGISRLIKSRHQRGNDLNNGNITQALISASSLQVKKNIRPIIIDYYTTNRNLHVVDRSFLIWLDSQTRDELFQDLGIQFLLCRSPIRLTRTI